MSSAERVRASPLRRIMRAITMTSLNYALVAYVTNPVGQFVENLRGEVQPEQAHLPAHLTILPPRPLSGSEAEALETIAQVCLTVEPFEVTMGDVETFIPLTPTVFIRVAHAAYRMRELHDRLNTSVLRCEEPWPYMPHLTIFKMESLDRAQEAFHLAHDRWSQYRGTRRILVDGLTFVREADQSRWSDLAPIPLGRRLAPATC
jgi:2'-5' RNA ligase